MTTNFITIFSISLIMISAFVFQVSFIHLILFGLVQIGIALLVMQGQLMLQELNNFYLSSVSAFCLGLLSVYFYHRYKKISNVIFENKFNKLNFGEKGLFRATFIFSLFIIFHYFVQGIPILHRDFDIRRFMVASSGLLGIPSRISVYGPIVIMFFNISYYISGWISRKKFIFISSLCLIFILLSGHKSSFISYIYIFICSYRLLKGKMKRNLPIIILLCLPLVFYSIYLQFYYFSTLIKYDFTEYLIQRITYISINPLIHIFYNQPALELVSPYKFLHDLLYPFFKILDLDIVSINTQISHSLYNIPYRDFTVPVTYTFVGYVKLEFGVYGGIIASFGFGIISALIYYLTQNQYTNIGRGAMISFEYLILIGLTSGNLFYLLPNFLFVLILFILLIAIFNHALIRTYKHIGC